VNYKLHLSGCSIFKLYTCQGWFQQF